QEIAEVRIVAPTRTFDRSATVDLGGRSVELRHLGRAHTDNDIVVIVPDAGVVFAGDLVEEGGPPYFGDSYPLEWPATDEALLGLVGGPVVPGHGAVVDAAFVRNQLEQIEAGVAARRAHQEGSPIEAAMKDVPF